MRFPNPVPAAPDPGVCRTGWTGGAKRRAAAMLAGVTAATCATAQQAQGPASPARLERISVWGVPQRDTDRMAGETRRVLQSVAVERSRWSESAPGRPRVAQRAALAGAAAGDRSGVDITDVSYRWGVGDAREALDVGLGAGAYRLTPGTDPVGPGGAVGYATDGRRDAIVPTLSVGVRHSLSQQHRIDLYASGSASLASPAVGEFYTARLKLEWLPTKDTGLGLEQAAVNMRFGPNSNLALRVRGGGPVLYYRAKF